jgi:hypothetical protein
MTEASEIIFRFWWIVALYFVGFFSPVFCPIVYAYLRRRSLRRKALFVLAVASLACGTPIVLYFLVAVPTWAAAVFLVPTLYATGHKDELWLKTPMYIANFFAAWWWVIVPAVTFAWSIVVTIFVGRRWSFIASWPASRPHIDSNEGTP